VVRGSKLCGDIVAHYLKLAKRRPTVAFATNVAHSKALVEMFCAAGVLAEHLDGKMPKRVRERIIARARRGEIQVLVNVDICVEGLDIPELSCAILARPTRSLTKMLQAVGRIMRPHPGKKDAIVLDHAGCVHLHGLPTLERSYSLGGYNPAPAGAAASALRRCKGCSLVLTGPCDRCPACGADFARPVRDNDDLPRVDASAELKRVLATPASPGVARRGDAARKRDPWRCQTCRSLDVSVIIRGFGEFSRLFKCQSCQAEVVHTDHERARRAGPASRRDEYLRIEKIRRSKGFEWVWTRHKYRDLFGCWPEEDFKMRAANGDPEIAGVAGREGDVDAQ
jgi:hypothetical protein